MPLRSLSSSNSNGAATHSPNGVYSSIAQLNGVWTKIAPPGGLLLPPEETALPAAVTVSLVSIVRSAIPCLLFFLLYGLNGHLRIVPTATDAHCVKLHNVSRLEQFVFSVSLHDVISAASHPVLDVLAAVPYLLHYLIPIAYPIWLYRSGRPDIISSFFTLLGAVIWTLYAVWFLYPTAPPWVFHNLTRYREMGITPPSIQQQPREGCAFERLDRLTGVPLFHGIFSGNPVPFASFPSGHVAWPTTIAVSMPCRGGLCSMRKCLAFCYILWVSWATVYSCHHYLIDILAALVVVFAADWVIKRLNRQRVKSELKRNDSFALVENEKNGFCP